MKIRIEVDPEVYARVCAAINDRESPIHPRASEFLPDKYPMPRGDGPPLDKTFELIKFKGAKVLGSELLELDLEVKERIYASDFYKDVSTGSVYWFEDKPTTSGRLQPLWDLLGILPRATTADQKLNGIVVGLAAIAKVADDIINNPYDTDRASEKAREIVSLIKSIQRVVDMK